jgi:hypothetical protein
MSEFIALSDTPSQFLDPKKWAELQSFANNNLIALTYINAPYPGECEGPFERALRRYQVGRALLEECRRLLLQGKLIATRRTASGKQITIPADAWINLWPLFATGRANGPGVIFEQIEIYAKNTYKLERDCIGWLTSHPEVATQKKASVYFEARLALGKKLSHAIFNAAYKQVFTRKRGRPRKNPMH